MRYCSILSWHYFLEEEEEEEEIVVTKITIIGTTVMPLSH